MVRKYRARPRAWFDEGTEVVLLDDFSTPQCESPFGLFKGLRGGVEDEEVCDFGELEEEEE